MGLLKNAVPVEVKLALYNVNFISWFWSAVHIEPFWDLNKLPIANCFEYWATPPNWLAFIASLFISAIKTSYPTLSGASNTTAYSSSGAR